MDNRTQALMDFLDASHSVYHAVAYLEETLERAGYVRLREGECWKLVPGGKYVLTRGGSALLAFRIPRNAPRGFLITASHADRPTFKVKENGELCAAYTRLATEKYGGMIMSTWLDRPLSIAGRVLVETDHGAQCRLVDIDRDLAMIPSVAIHMNRNMNEGYAWNPAVDTLPLLGSSDAKGNLEALLEQEVGGKILGHDLYLYIRQKATVWGVDEEYISSAALDDLECVWGCTQGFLRAGAKDHVQILCVFDSEEVGSGSVQGAASDLLEAAIHRICGVLKADVYQLLANSFVISADNAHAIHPNHPEFADPKNAPVPGGGIVIKYNANQKYTTDGFTAALMRKICQKAQVPVQTYCNRADLPGGSTLGNISLSHVSVRTVDIGLAQLAMHSSYETASVKDALYLEEAMKVFYGMEFESIGDNFVIE